MRFTRLAIDSQCLQIGKGANTHGGEVQDITSGMLDVVWRNLKTRGCPARKYRQFHKLYMRWSGIISPRVAHPTTLSLTAHMNTYSMTRDIKEPKWGTITSQSVWVSNNRKMIWPETPLSSNGVDPQRRKRSRPTQKKRREGSGIVSIRRQWRTSAPPSLQWVNINAVVD